MLQLHLPEIKGVHGSGFIVNIVYFLRYEEKLDSDKLHFFNFLSKTIIYFLKQEELMCLF